MDSEQHAPDQLHDAPPSSPGSTLRIRRKQLGIPLEEAAEATKISKAFLLALEEDRFKDLPSQAYLKGFLRTYSVFLRLDADALIRQATAGSDTEDQLSTPSRSSGRITLPDFSSLLQRLALPALLLIGLLFSSLFIAPDSPPNRLASLRDLSAQKPLQAVVSSSIQTVASSAGIASKSAPAPVQQPEEPAAEKPSPTLNRDGFMARMKVAHNCTITVTIDDTASQIYELTGGDVIEWKAARQIAFELPGTDGIELSHNGSPVRLPAAAGKAGYMVLDSNGLRR